MRILVTGGSGFLGTALTSFLAARGHEVTSLSSNDGDLTIPSTLEGVTSGIYDLIFHLAAWTQAGDFCLKHPGEQWIINQKINTNVLDYWASGQPGAKLVFMGTSCAYAPGSDLRETAFMLGEPIESLYTYAMTKRMLYQGARALNLQYGLSYLCAGPSTLYGPGYHTDGRQMHFIFDLIRKIIRGREIGEEVVLWGDGYQRREIVYVDDFIRILWSLCESRSNDIFNIGAGEESTIRTFAEHICEIVGYDPGKIRYDTMRYVGAPSKCLNVDKVRSLVSYNLTPLDVGLREAINWFYSVNAYAN
jgi:GDP-L-fucose synthase